MGEGHTLLLFFADLFLTMDIRRTYPVVSTVRHYYFSARRDLPDPASRWKCDVIFRTSFEVFKLKRT
jgi:hypothetical protein